MLIRVTGRSLSFPERAFRFVMERSSKKLPKKDHALGLAEAHPRMKIMALGVGEVGVRSHFGAFLAASPVLDRRQQTLADAGPAMAGAHVDALEKTDGRGLATVDVV